MKKLLGILAIFSALIFCIISTSLAVDIVCIGLETERQGICDIWDVIEIQDDGVIGGPGYELFEIVHVSNMTKAELMPLLYLIMVEVEKFYNSEGDLVDFWYNENSNPSNWYEVHIDPKYTFTVEDFTHEDIVTLADELATTSAKAEVITKVKDKITMYPQNYLDTVPKQK